MRTCSLSFRIIISMTFMHTFSFSVLGPFLLAFCVKPRVFILFYPNLSEGADRAGGQLRGDKECPFSGITKSGRVWRKVPESDARSVSPSIDSAFSRFL